MLSTLIDKAAAYTLPIVLVALAGSLSWGVVQTLRLYKLESELASERSAYAEERATAERVARQMAERNAALQASHAAKQQETLRAFNDALAAQEVAVAAATADAASLRDAVECYASGRCIGANADPVTGGTCDARAATLGKLFGRADTLAGRMARAADKHADEVRALKRQLLLDRARCGVGTNGAQEEQ